MLQLAMVSLKNSTERWLSYEGTCLDLYSGSIQFKPWTNPDQQAQPLAHTYKYISTKVHHLTHCHVTPPVHIHSSGH
jgi:hypothetical protein